MALRIEAATGAVVTVRVIIAALAAICPLIAQSGTYEVRHQHAHNGAMGELRIGETSVAFSEKGKHPRTWSYDDIQQLTLSPDRLRIVTYEDQKWQLGRDRVYVFDRLPADLAGNAYRLLADRLDQRFVAAFADNQVEPIWRVPAKLAHGRSGPQGVLLFGADKVVFRTRQAGESRTWRIKDIENVASADAFDLTITTHERDFRFQLKQELPEAQFRQFWLRINSRRGLEILTSRSQVTGQIE
jgi:hypothetical protein